MADIIDVLTSRKSIRRYKPDPIPDEMIDKILEAARWAPTGENYQPWRFIVIRNPKTKDKIGRLAKLGSGSRMTAWHCLGETQERFKKIKDPEKKAEVFSSALASPLRTWTRHSPQTPSPPQRLLIKTSPLWAASAMVAPSSISTALS